MRYAQLSRPGKVCFQPEEQTVELFGLASYEWEKDVGLQSNVLTAAAKVACEKSSATILKESITPRDKLGEAQINILSNPVAGRVLENIGA